MTDQTVLSAISRITGLEFPDPRIDGKWATTKVVGRDLVYAAVGLFFLDIGWRLEDLMIDFICSHIFWLNWLGD